MLLVLTEAAHAKAVQCFGRILCMYNCSLSHQVGFITVNDSIESFR